MFNKLQYYTKERVLQPTKEYDKYVS